MGVNYFSYFLLTNLLFPLINKTPDSRIISLSSNAHKRGKIDFENLNTEKEYSKMCAYSQSKLACLMFAYELQRRIDQAGSSVISVSAHPCIEYQFRAIIQRAFYNLMLPLTPLFMHSIENAVLPTLQAALDPSVNGGEYFGPTGFNGMKGKPGKVTSMPQSHDLEVAKQLWKESERLTGKPFSV